MDGNFENFFPNFYYGGMTGIENGNSAFRRFLRLAPDAAVEATERQRAAMGCDGFAMGCERNGRNSINALRKMRKTLLSGEMWLLSDAACFTQFM